MLVHIRAVIQYLPVQFDPGMRLESSAFLSCADMQFPFDTGATQQPPKGHRALETVGIGRAVQFRGADGARGAQGRLAL